jgi:hypothetical protein
MSHSRAHTTDPTMGESWKSRLSRWGFNWFPAYRSTGARIDYVAHGWREVRIRLSHVREAAERPRAIRRRARAT